MTFPNIFSSSLPPNPYQKNPNAVLPSPSSFDENLYYENDIHVPNQLPYPSYQTSVPQFGFDFSLTQSEGDYWIGSSPRFRIWGHANYWNDNGQTSKEEQEQNKQNERWNRENAEMAKTLPPVDQEFSSELENFVNSHTNSKIVPD